MLVMFEQRLIKPQNMIECICMCLVCLTKTEKKETKRRNQGIHPNLLPLFTECQKDTIYLGSAL